MTFLETARRLLAAVIADVDNGYHDAIRAISQLPKSGDRDSDAVIYLAGDMMSTLRHCEDGWVPQGKVTFSRDELYDLWEAGLIDEPVIGERMHVNFMLRDE